MNYEINFLVLQSKTVELPEMRLKVKELIQKMGGQITEEKEYSKRKLAYKIRKESYGFHTVFRFEMEDKEKVSQLKRELNLEDKISRYLIVRAEDLLSLSELEEKLKKASEEKTHLSQEELGKFLKEKKPVSEKAETVAPVLSTEEKPVLNQEKPAKVTTEKKEIPAETETKPEENMEKLEKAEEQKEEEKPLKKEDKISMDELDKKLDEILNI